MSIINGKFLSFLVPLVLSNMLNPLNSTMLSTAVITILTTFAEPSTSASLLIVPLYFASAVGQPLMGRLCDIFNPNAINILGFLLILLSALIGVFALTFEWLIVSRVLLGLGSSTAYPSSITLVRNYYQRLKKDVPGVVLSIIAIAGQISAVFGPFLGAVLLEGVGWQGIFIINIPLVIIGLIFGFNQINKHAAVNIYKENTRMNFFTELDIVGFLLFSGFLFSFMLIFIQPAPLYLKIFLVILFLLLFVLHGRKHPKPFIDIQILRSNASLAAIFIRQIGANFIMYLILYTLPQWLEQVRLLTPSEIGLIMLPFSIMTMVLSVGVSKSKRYNLLLLISICCLCMATIGLFIVRSSSPIYLIIAITMMVGIATGILMITNQVMLYVEVSSESTGVSFGLFRTAGYIGAILAGAALTWQFDASNVDGDLSLLASLSLTACLMLIFLLLPGFFKKEGSDATLNKS